MKKEYKHTDDDCPNMETIKKLKGEIKRLRQEIILKGTSRKKQHNLLDDSEDFSDDSNLDEEERAALRMLAPDQRKLLAELDQAGANKQYIKKKIR